MNIELTTKEFRRLLDLVFIGNWVLNSTRGDDRFEDYDNVESKLFALCKGTPMESLVEDYNGKPIPSQAFNDGGIHEAIVNYEDVIFYDVLAEELARRDLRLEDSDPEDFTELSARMEEYLSEFDKNGLSTINIDL